MTFSLKLVSFLEGSVQRTSDRVRVNAQLIDATTGKHLWAERYDRDAKRLFDIQDEIVKTIVATLAFKVDATERERVMSKAPGNKDGNRRKRLINDLRKAGVPE